jgi:hypothetical protein
MALPRNRRVQIRCGCCPIRSHPRGSGEFSLTSAGAIRAAEHREPRNETGTVAARPFVCVRDGLALTPPATRRASDSKRVPHRGARRGASAIGGVVWSFARPDCGPPTIYGQPGVRRRSSGRNDLCQRPHAKLGERS